jgi:hypothetical protein
MKTIFPVAAVVLALLLSGCAMFRQNSPGVQKPANTAKPVANNGKPANTATNSAVQMATEQAKNQQMTKPTIVTPDTSLSARVVAANDVGRFVIINFSSEHLPKMDQSLFLYRAGLKVAEVKVTGPQSDNNVVADLVSGDAHVGDSVRAE